MQRRSAFENFVAHVSVFLLRLCGVSNESQIDAPPEFAADLHAQRLQRADGKEMMTRSENRINHWSGQIHQYVDVHPLSSQRCFLLCPPDHRRAPPAAAATAICTARVLHEC